MVTLAMRSNRKVSRECRFDSGPRLAALKREFWECPVQIPRVQGKWPRPYKATPMNFELRVRESFEKQAVMHTLGMSLQRVAKGEVDITFDHREDLTQQHGFIHAGVLATALDSACGYAAFSTMSEDAAVLSIEFKTNLLRPAKGSIYSARARVVKAGRNITFCEASAFAHSEDKEVLVATMSATMMAVRGREDVNN